MPSAAGSAHTKKPPGRDGRGASRVWCWGLDAVVEPWLVAAIGAAIGRVLGVVAEVAELLAHVVAEVAELVGQVLFAISLAPGLLGGLLGLAVSALQVVHGWRSSVWPANASL